MADDPEERELRAALAQVPIGRLREMGLLEELRQLAGLDPGSPEPEVRSPEEVDEMDVDDLVRRTMERVDAGVEG